MRKETPDGVEEVGRTNLGIRKQTGRENDDRPFLLVVWCLGPSVKRGTDDECDGTLGRI